VTSSLGAPNGVILRCALLGGGTLSECDVVLSPTAGGVTPSSPKRVMDAELGCTSASVSVIGAGGT
jgi:hypothetical protein